MNYKASDICVCGHTFLIHDPLEGGWCMECLFSDGRYGNGVEECESFKLDNLRYVEDAAKKRKLV
jgi:hypothetical protein